MRPPRQKIWESVSASGASDEREEPNNDDITTSSSPPPANAPRGGRGRSKRTAKDAAVDSPGEDEGRTSRQRTRRASESDFVDSTDKEDEAALLQGLMVGREASLESRSTKSKHEVEDDADEEAVGEEEGEDEAMAEVDDEGEDEEELEGNDDDDSEESDDDQPPPTSPRKGLTGPSPRRNPSVTALASISEYSLDNVKTNRVRRKVTPIRSIRSKMALQDVMNIAKSLQPPQSNNENAPASAPSAAEEVHKVSDVARRRKDLAPLKSFTHA